MGDKQRRFEENKASLETSMWLLDAVNKLRLLGLQLEEGLNMVDVPLTAQELVAMEWQAMAPAAFRHRQAEALARCKNMVAVYYCKPMREVTERLCRGRLQGPSHECPAHMFVKLANLIVRSSLRKVREEEDVTTCV